MTDYGGRFLDACAYESYSLYVTDPNHPVTCWEIKSTSTAMWRYYVGSQSLKDQWLRRNYHFPIYYLFP